MKYLISQGVIAAAFVLLGVTILIQEPTMSRPCALYAAFGAVLSVVGIALFIDLRNVIWPNNQA